MDNFKRNIPLPHKSFFLFGPRGTGKSTWLKEVLKDAMVFDLLKSKVFLDLSRDPALLREHILATKPKWVVIDEIQKLPILLDEVHSLIFEYKNEINFALTGSSARKLKKSHANLLAGRALTKKLYPLTLGELGEKQYKVEDLLQYGCLPEVLTLCDHLDKVEFIESYTQTYLKEEIQLETQVRDLNSFNRFLSILAILNAEQVNFSNIAREVGLARTTIQGHFSIIIDTLLGTLLESYRPKAKVKEVIAPKFYLFDTGVINCLSGKLREGPNAQESGKLLETLFLNELRAFDSYYRQGGEIYFWRTSGGSEVDFLYKRGSSIIAFEIKASTKWKKDYNAGINILFEKNIIQDAYGIYLGKEHLNQGRIKIRPFENIIEIFSDLK